MEYLRESLDLEASKILNGHIFLIMEHIVETTSVLQHVSGRVVLTTREMMERQIRVLENQLLESQK